MYVCTYMCMYTCTCMSCIYSMSWINRYIHISISTSPSRHHLARCQQRRWQYQRLEIWFENPGVIEVHELYEVFVDAENHSLVHQIVRRSFDPCEKQSNVQFLQEKKSWLRNEGSWPVPPRGNTTGMGRERELRVSQNYSPELRERTPLQNYRRVFLSWLRFHNEKFDEMCCKLDSTENPLCSTNTATPVGMHCVWLWFSQPKGMRCIYVIQQPLSYGCRATPVGMHCIDVFH